MGKFKRKKPSEIQLKSSLEDDIEKARFAQPKNRNKTRLRQDEDEEFVDSDLSKKILRSAREQLRELEGSGEGPSKRNVPEKFEDEEDSHPEENIVSHSDMFNENIDIGEEEERRFEAFMSENRTRQKTLADFVKGNLLEGAELQSNCSEFGLPMKELDPRQVQLYKGVGEVLKVYRSGKLPKAFKVIPSFKDWQTILRVTDPENWSAAAMYQATRLFVSNLPEHKAQEFLSLVLLPRIRDDINDYKRLNAHLYQALKKALYKPGAFMKGILLPMLQCGDCTLREAVIIGSIVAQNSIKYIHSATTMLKIAEMEYTGANSIFLRILIDKKYALPYSVIDGLVHHFLKFRFDKRELPVLWHQALLTFVQRYKDNISEDQCTELLDLLHKHTHSAITPEIRRELQNAKFRNTIQEPSVQPSMDIDQS